MALRTDYINKPAARIFKFSIIPFFYVYEISHKHVTKTKHVQQLLWAEIIELALSEGIPLGFLFSSK